MPRALPLKLVPPTVAFVFFLVTFTIFLWNLSESHMVSVPLGSGGPPDEDQKLLVSLSSSSSSSSSLFGETNASVNSTRSTTVVVNGAQHFESGLVISFSIFFILALIVNIANFLDFFIPSFWLTNTNNNNALKLRISRYFSTPLTTRFKYFYLANILISGASGFSIYFSFVTMLSWTRFNDSARFKRDEEASANNNNNFYNVKGGKESFDSTLAFWILLLLTGIVQIGVHWLQFTYDDEVLDTDVDDDEDDVNDDANDDDQYNKQIIRMSRAQTASPFYYHPLKVNERSRRDDRMASRATTTTSAGATTTKVPDFVKALRLLSGGEFSAEAWTLRGTLAIVFGSLSFVVHAITLSLLAAAYDKDYFWNQLVPNNNNNTTISNNNNTPSSSSGLFVQRLTDGFIFSLLSLLAFAVIVSLINTLEWICIVVASYRVQDKKSRKSNSKASRSLSSFFLIDTISKKLIQIYANRLVSGTHLLLWWEFVIYSLNSVVVAKGFLHREDGEEQEGRRRDLIVAFLVFLGLCCCIFFSCTHYFVPNFLLGPLMRELNFQTKDRELEEELTQAFALLGEKRLHEGNEENAQESNNKNSKRRTDPRDPENIMNKCRELKERDEVVQHEEQEDDDDDGDDNNNNKQTTKNKKWRFEEICCCPIPTEEQEGEANDVRTKKAGVVVVDFLDPTFIPRNRVLPSNYDGGAADFSQRRRSRTSKSKEHRHEEQQHHYHPQINTAPSPPIEFKKAAGDSDSESNSSSSSCDDYHDNFVYYSNNNNNKHRLQRTKHGAKHKAKTTSNNNNDNYFNRISRDLVDVSHLEPDRTKHWLNLARKMKKWNSYSPYIFWQRFEDFSASLIPLPVLLLPSTDNASAANDGEHHGVAGSSSTNGSKETEAKKSSPPSSSPSSSSPRPTTTTTTIATIPRLLSSFHPFPVLLTSAPPAEESINGATRNASFPSSGRLLAAVAFLSSSPDTVRLLFQLFEKSAFEKRHLVSGGNGTSEDTSDKGVRGDHDDEKKKKQMMRIRSGCFHTSFNFGGIWRHIFLDTLVPLQQPPFAMMRDQANIPQQTSRNSEPASHSCFDCCCAANTVPSSAAAAAAAARGRLLAPSSALDPTDIHLPLIQKGLAKLTGAYSSAATEISVDVLDELHDLCGLPVERFAWPNFYRATYREQQKQKQKQKQHQHQHHLRRSFGESNDAAILTSAFVEIDSALKESPSIRCINLSSS